jgi:TolB protein
LGSNRVYARVKQPATYAAWVEAIKAGRAFVSNGPILEFDAGGHEPGDVVQFHGASRLKARVTARSILPFTTLEIVVNGQTVAHKTVPVPKNPAVDGLYSMEVETTLDLVRSAWVAARVAEHPDLRAHILPRSLSVFAHTAPIYFLQDNRKVRDEASIVYLRKYVQGVLHWLGTDPPFKNPADRQAAQRTAQEALRVYKAL